MHAVCTQMVSTQGPCALRGRGMTEIGASSAALSESSRVRDGRARRLANGSHMPQLLLRCRQKQPANKSKGNQIFSNHKRTDVTVRNSWNSNARGRAGKIQPLRWCEAGTRSAHCLRGPRSVAQYEQCKHAAVCAACTGGKCIMWGHR